METRTGLDLAIIEKQYCNLYNLEGPGVVREWILSVSVAKINGLAAFRSAWWRMGMGGILFMDAAKKFPRGWHAKK